MYSVYVCVWFVPSAPDRIQRSGNLARRQSRAGGCTEARPDCGSAHGSQPLKTSHLKRDGGAVYREKIREKPYGFQVQYI